MTIENRRTPSKPSFCLAASVLALALFLSPVSAAAAVVCSGPQTYSVPGTYATISLAVAAITPTTLTEPVCVTIGDSSTYAEQVTVQGFTTGGSSITIQAAPGQFPVLQPPSFSTAAFMIANDSVNVMGIAIAPPASIPYGIKASSAYVQISSVSVIDGTGYITGAGVSISSWSSISDSSVAVQNAYGVLLNGVGNTSITYTTITANGGSFAALYLNGASFNTITNSDISNPPGEAVYLNAGSSKNTISMSTMTSSAATKKALYLWNSSSNAITQSFISNPLGYGASLIDSGYNTISLSTLTSNAGTAQALYVTGTGSIYNLIANSAVSNPNGHAGMINFGADHSDVVQSTFTSNLASYRALEINSVSSITVTQSQFHSNIAGGYGLFVSSSIGVSVQQSQMDSLGYGLWVDVSTGVKVTGSFVQGNPSAYIRASTGTLISSGTLATPASGGALWIAGGNVGFAAANVTISAVSATDGISLDNGAGMNAGLLSFSSITIVGPTSGFSISA
ncbi:MAG: hypothetical protein COV48_10635, partial [Elusimicrobia bacterium CG11_big_fil_rev_8_21_14_0_20_64_6]